MMKKFLFLTLTLFVALNTEAQQQQMYTQFMYNKLSLNPAFAGNDPYTCMTLLYRDQWAGFPGSPTAQVFSINFPNINEKVGLGVNFERQSIGITEKITYEGIYAYKFKMGDGVLSMGMNISGRNHVQDFRDPRLFAIQGIEDDPSIPKERFSQNLFNAGFGVYYNTNLFFVGAAIPRMIKTDLDFDNNDYYSSEVRHLMFMTGGSFSVDKDFRLTPHLLVRAAENSPFSADLNLTGVFQERYSAGLTYRTGGGPSDFGESLDLIFSFQVSDRWMIGFAHDITLSQIRAIDNGSLEVIMSYCFLPKKIKTVVVNPRYF